MKRFCIIENANQLATTVATRLGNELGHFICYKGDSCYLEADGTFHFVMRDEDTGMFSIEKRFTPKEIAERLDYLNWEVVSVQDGDAEELALMFYA